MPFKKYNFRLHITISWVFVLLTLPVMITLVWVNYRANLSVIEDYSNQLIEKSVRQTMNDTLQLLGPIQNAVRSARSVMQAQPEYVRSAVSGDYLHDVVTGQASVYSAYAGWDDGSFHQVYRALPGVAVLGQTLPQSAQFVENLIDTRSLSGGAPAQARYRVHGDWAQPLLTTLNGPANYDPRQRSWYKEAVRLKAPGVTDVYTFVSSGQLGFTVFAPLLVGELVQGVFAVDVSLSGLSRYLAETRVTPHSLSIIADEGGRVIAHSDVAHLQKTKDWKTLRLSTLGDDRVLGALAERLRSGGKHRFQFKAGDDGTEYLAVFSNFPAEFNKPWELLIIIPTDDFVGIIKDTNRHLLLIGFVAFCVQIVLINLISRAISRPMEQLAQDVSNIRQFKFDLNRVVHSPVGEINHLAQAVHLLTHALASFTSYVPRGLVQQLIDSGHGTRLGVESRYLTLFFTDLVGFSALSETEPSQQLLGRVSDYFSSVTRAIEETQGTVDKYIGDAVMAFWGAPHPLDSHAYLACVAAVRSHRQMRQRNLTWMSQGLAPLKVRIGIHSAAVLVGNVGSAERMCYTVMGDGVNITARLEALNRELGTTICVSDSVYREAGERLWLRPVDVVSVKGRRGELLVYELLGIRDSDAEVAASSDDITLCQLTVAAYALYSQQNWEQAEAAYAIIAEQFPDDLVAQRMRAKCYAALAVL